ncbi:tRNA:m(4)X modification enzyme TRM13 homolog isoform X6 [Hyla sarda]|uniref:tRNA:m(4)X modification enzyme TRM13 homolog isoform X6 n=1 Tax=Hyla sarda TaxID=327740 RepID=UPI0024C2DA42|nr:tRNA:m(4)X modification enzyme TRM13 homolog isoform X6 [Hyla sarda]
MMDVTEEKRGPCPDPGAAGGPLPGRCSHFVHRKKRFCKMIVSEGKKYCGEHAENGEEQNSRMRIPCPLDPKHTVYEDQLQKHLKKCNSREKPQPVFYVHNVNSGAVTADASQDQVSLSSLSKEEIKELADRLLQVTKGLDPPLPDRKLCHPALHEALNDPANGDSASKHLKQQVDGKQRKSTFQRLHIDIQHLCLDRVPSLVEKQLPVIGIGKHLCGAGTDLALRCLVHHYSNPDGEPRCKRSRTDAEQTVRAEPPYRCHVDGIVIALCCHHRCDWQHYVGRDFFEKLGLGQREFGLFQRMSSWATCGARRPAQAENSGGKGNSEDMEEHDADQKNGDCNTESVQGLQLSVEEREHFGRLCKLLLDRGRVDYLERMGYKASLEYYTEPEVSLENVILTALPQSDS